MSRIERKYCKFLNTQVRIRIKTKKIKDGNSDFDDEVIIGRECLDSKKFLLTVCKPSKCICVGGRENPFIE